MSLKAKLEAVIYAAEEPVTLAQLAALFTADALEWKAEQEAASAEQAARSGHRRPLPLLTNDRSGRRTHRGRPSCLRAGQDEAPETSEDPAADPRADAEPAEEATQILGRRANRARAPGPPARPRSACRDPQLLDELIADYARDGRGMEIREIAGGYRMATKPECHDAVRSL